MNISKKQYHCMCRDAVSTLENIWGRDKFEAWYRETILPMNGKVYLDYHSYYTILKGELDGLMELYDEVFVGNESMEWAKETQELRGAM